MTLINNKFKRIMNITNRIDFENQYKMIINAHEKGVVQIIGINIKKLNELLNEGGIFIDTSMPFTMNCKKIIKISKPFNGNNRHNHNISSKNFIDALSEIINPEYITRDISKPNNYTFYTTVKDKRDNNILVGITFDYLFKRIQVNNIDTIFGYDEEKNNYLKTGKNIGTRMVVYAKEKGWLPALDASPSLNKD